MFCTRCGIQLTDTAKYCSACGAATPNAGFQPPSPAARLSRPEEGKKIAGVCAGVARYFGLDVSLVRIVWVIVCFWPPFVGVIAYIVCWAVIPRDPLPMMGAAQGSPAGTGPA